MELNLQIQEVLKHYPDLSFNEINNSIDGELFISKDDSYDVSIELEPYPRHFPRLFEVSERIPRKVTRHTYTDTGSCCLSTQAKAQILMRTEVETLYLFVKEVVVPYFQNNSYFEINGHYKTDEYSHDKLGIIEGYRDILQSNNDLLIARLMINRIEYKKLKMHDLCYCGSGQIMKKCHNGRHHTCYKDFRKIDIELLQCDLRIFIDKIKKGR
ncbi:hypothetical protein L3049_06450 [Labilibaculum sp. DW002]|uniref:Uncharacterized protein n=1 Tax=Paralabilibaculum antarcticum TaxID=2912572 RepID=A0ABT5VQW3_9BACT|nr:hypothetical protein [Labilibaculum sp. DW002]MDE5417645.1 hypothetical protein [Labilibaculum sp. DW002]